MDQNTTTIITSALTVIGTLGGVVLGVVLSNRYVARQAKANKNASVIEEVYILLTNIEAEISENIDHKHPILEGKPIRDYIRRTQTLIHLYLPSLIEKLKAYSESLFQFSSKVFKEQQTNNPQQVWENTSEEYKAYKQGLNELRKALEKLVR